MQKFSKLKATDQFHASAFISFTIDTVPHTYKHMNVQKVFILYTATLHWWGKTITVRDGSDIQGRSVDITQPLGSRGRLWKLRISME